MADIVPRLAEGADSVRARLHSDLCTFRKYGTHIFHRDLILIHPSPAYEPGDVVTFQEEGELITHRIIAETKEGFWVQGDANNVRDEKPVKSDAVIGKVVLILPGVGRAAIFFRSPRGIMILASIVLVTAILTCRRREEEERWKQ